jgi:hypothetical protein
VSTCSSLDATVQQVPVAGHDRIDPVRLRQRDQEVVVSVGGPGEPGAASSTILTRSRRAAMYAAARPSAACAANFSRPQHVYQLGDQRRGHEHIIANCPHDRQDCGQWKELPV